MCTAHGKETIAASEDGRLSCIPGRVNAAYHAAMQHNLLLTLGCIFQFTFTTVVISVALCLA